MDVFVPDQQTAGDGWRILGGAANLPGPPNHAPRIDLYTGDGLSKPLAYLGLPPGADLVDPTRDVIAVADVLLGDDRSDAGCGRIRLVNVTFDPSAAAVRVHYDAPISTSNGTPLACRDRAVPGRFIIALSVDHLPTGRFALVLEEGADQVAIAEDVAGPPPPAPNDGAAVVDDVGAFPKQGVWVRHGRSLWTTLGGDIRRWSRLTLPADPISLDVIDSDRVVFVAAGPDSVWPYEGNGTADTLHLVVYRTTDGGASWHSAAIDGNAGGLQPVLRFLDGRSGYILLAAYRGGPESRVLVTSDGGATWSDRHATQAALQGVTVPGSLGAIFSIGPDGSLWAGSQGDAGPVARPILDVSRDGGRTWMDARLPGLIGDEAAPDHLLGPVTFFGETGVVAAATFGESNPVRIFDTNDGGRTWTHVTAQPGSDFAGSFAAASPDDWYLATSQGVFATHDAGRTWLHLAAGRLAVAIVDRLVFIDPTTALAIAEYGEGTPATHLYSTRDGGASWDPVQLLTSTP